MSNERSPADLLTLVSESSQGSARATNDLAERLYSELRYHAGRLLAQERPDHTLQATALVNEAWLRLERGDPIDWRSRAHFRAVAANVMRRILVDHARGKRRRPHGVTLDDAADNEAAVDPIELDEALEQLAQADERQARIVVMRYYGGMSDMEIGAELGVSDRTVRTLWLAARAWLRSKLGSRE